MDRSIKTWLFDILNSIEEIESYFEGKPKNFLEYCKDTKQKGRLNAILKSLVRQ
jgi:hypothetical protein